MRRGFPLLLGVACLSPADPGAPVEPPVDTAASPDRHTGAEGSSPTSTSSSTDRGGFCEVRRMFDRACVVCHNAPSHQGGLDLETDPWAELVGVISPAHGAARVEPGDPAGSLLWRKMDGSQSWSEGAVMPPRGVQPADAELVRAWIEAGAPESCDPTGTAPSP